VKTHDLAHNLVDLCCNRLAAEGVAWIRRTHPPTTQTREGRRIFTGGGLPDYVGFRRDGRGVLFDLKSTQSDRFTWRDRRRDVTSLRQHDDLTRAGRGFNVLAGLLVLFWAGMTPMPAGLRAANVDAMVWVPWQGADVLYESATSVTLADLVTLFWGERVTWPTNDDPNFLAAAVIAEHRAVGQPRG